MLSITDYILIAVLILLAVNLAVLLIRTGRGREHNLLDEQREMLD